MPARNPNASVVRAGTTSSLPETAVLPVHRVPAALARHFHLICLGAIADALAGEDLTPLQYVILAYLDDEPEIDQNSLAARAGVEKSHASLLVEQLETRGLLQRRINGADRRARLLRLTPEGEKLRRRLRPKTQAANDRIVARLTRAERKLLVDLLVRIIDDNQVYDRPSAGRRGRPSRR